MILRFSSIGDIVLTTPVVRCVAKQTGAEIHFLTRRRFAELLTGNPYISRLWTYEQSPAEQIELLRQEGFDAIIDLHKNFRSRALVFRLGRPAISFDKLNVRKWLFVRLGINCLPPLHLVDRYFRALAPEGIVYDGEGLDVFFAQPGSPPVELPKRFIAGILGATYSTKQIPFEQWQQILPCLDLPVVLLGGEREVALGQTLAAQHPGKAISIAGISSLMESALVIREADMVITPDTGMMHIAAALGKPLHVVWGNTHPAFGMGPFLKGEVVKPVHHAVSGLRCRPCSKLGFDRCPKGHFRCMRDQQFSKAVF
ncbi:MAG: glycosyltransferase family 9 protein [Saprospiraceae bacterium]|nr:glycosyltransferase family 9 protein [Saprospiraceae bacterium]MBP9209209.1 glycosyltransferase family 9 protein [Saprospiraceae bacterium]